MPIPLSALIITSFPVFVGTEHIINDIVYQYVYIGILVMNAVLMVSGIFEKHFVILDENKMFFRSYL